MNHTGDRYLHTTDVHNLDDPGIIVPLLIQLFQPSSLVDVGCGLGNFLKVFCDHGITDVVGVDGEWVDRSKLYCAEACFVTRDLEQPLDVGRRFDLVLCLEVAEHISPAAADVLVQSLVQLGDRIVFSAALPGQGGDNHLNEQDVAYWQAKFEQYGYVFIDLFRNTLWNDQRLKWWYRQNMFLVAKKGVVLNEVAGRMLKQQTIHTLVHPELFRIYHERYMHCRRRILSLEAGTFSTGYYCRLLLKVIRVKISRLFTGSSK